MPRLVQYWIPRLSVEEAAEVGPPWHLTSNGGFSHVGRGVIGIVWAINKPNAVRPAEVGNSIGSTGEITDPEVCSIENVGRFLQNPIAARTEIKHDDARRMRRRTGNESGLIAMGAQRGELRERCIEMM